MSKTTENRATESYIRDIMCVTLNNGVKHAKKQEQEKEMIDGLKWARDFTSKV